MKCPKKPNAIITEYAYNDTRQTITFGECDGEDCAWWDGLNAQCAVLIVAWRLNNIEEMLGDLAYKKGELK